jgi:hypothetical protein
MDDLATQTMKAYDRHIAGQTAMARLVAARVCPKCGQKATACMKAVDSMFSCGFKPW